MPQLTRRDFLRLCGTSSVGLALAACGVAPTPTAAPAPTSTVAPTNTLFPTAITKPILTNTPAPTSTATATATATPRPPTLRDFASKIKVGTESFRIGTMADYGNQYRRDPRYLETIRSEFNLIVPAGSFHEKNLTLRTSEAKFWAEFAQEEGIPFQIKSMFWQGDLPSSLNKAKVTKDEVKQYIEERIRTVLPYVSRKVSTIIVLANEPFWNYRGQRGWMGEYNQDWDRNPYYAAFGEGWIGEAYVALHNISTKEFNLVPGKDFTVIGLNVPGIESANPMTDFVIKQVTKIKMDISAKLGMPADSVPFDLGS